MIAAVWLGWQILSVPIMERAPPAIALRLAPGSPLVLRRAAEDELAAKRYDNAEVLARRALQAAPFDVRALSVLGMAIAQRDERAADDILTLAGNWSLRDGPTHAWLMYERLKQGNYSSAFAHADTLARRDKLLQSPVLDVFITAGLQDSRAVAPLLKLLAAPPPWRDVFFERLYRQPRNDALLATLVAGLQQTSAPVDDHELGRVYSHWLDEGRIGAIKAVRERIGRPPVGELLVNGGFSDISTPAPFVWTLSQSADFTAVVMNDDRRRDEQALRVDYNGSASGVIAQQFLLLAPGAYRLALDARREAGDGESDMIWGLYCSDSRLVSEIRPTVSSKDGEWRRFEARFEISDVCPAQWLALRGRPGERRGARSVSWFDRIEITKTGD